MTASGAAIGLQDVTTAESQSYTGAVTFNGSHYSTRGGNFSIHGNAVLASDTTTIASGDGAIHFGGTLDGMGNLVSRNALSLAAGTGDIFFSATWEARPGLVR